MSGITKAVSLILSYKEQISNLEKKVELLEDCVLWVATNSTEKNVKEHVNKEIVKYNKRS